MTRPTGSALVRASGLALLGLLTGSPADAESDATSRGRLSHLDDRGLSYRFESLGYGAEHGLRSNSPLNPGNVLQWPHREARAEVRLDLQADFDDWLFGLKPRFELDRSSVESWLGDETENSARGFLQEWTIRYRLGNDLFVSYGRENLQWGPSFLISPSNPFIESNGKSNPYLEVPGMDYARLRWVVDSDLTAQFIANVDEGRFETLTPFSRVYAGKFDFVGTRQHGSLVLSQRDGGAATVGGYLGWSVSDAVLAHAEGSLTEGDGGRLLLGAGYTFDDGSMLTVEYYHNGRGCRESSLLNCLEHDTTITPGAFLMRSNYGFAQFIDNEFFIRPLQLALRGTVDLDDGSVWANAVLDYDLNDNVEVFTVLDRFTGGRNDSFGSTRTYSVMGGVRVSF